MNVFIDLGAYRGLYVSRFKKSKYYIPDTRIYAFECNPRLAGIDYGAGITTIRKAAWIYDGELKFYISKVNPAHVQGSSVYKEKRTGNLDREHPIKTPCIDFSKWLKDNFKPEDNIYLKMNIEGAEYDILEKMILDGTIDYIKTAWIQWHWQKCGIPQDRHNKIILELKKRSIVLLRGYDGLKT
jgi:FkbM family methyltransferase